MSLINNSYFIGKRNIPNILSADVSSNVTYLIGMYEDEYLQRLLGYELFKLFKAGIASGSPLQKWLDIRDGKEFTGRDGILYKWAGLVNITPVPNSPIADYVYYQWLKHNHTQTTGIGEVKNASQNATPIINKYKPSRAWNDMVESSSILWEMLVQDETNYPEYTNYQNSSEVILLLTRINHLF